MSMPNPRPSNQARITAAVWFAERGFGVFPCWSTHASGACRCPQGQACTSPGKHPLTVDGFKSATLDATRIRTFLAAASAPNYGLVAPEGVFVLDVDGEGWQARLAELEERYGRLPATFRDATANGQHIFLRWPDTYPRPLKQLFGWVTRWGSGPHSGYVIGPRSVHASGAEYRPVEGTVPDIAMLPDAWAAAGVTPERTVTVRSGPHFDTVTAGGRHEFLRDRARTLRGGGLTGESLFTAVMQVNEEYCVPPKSADEVRRAIGDVETKFAADPIEASGEYGERASGGTGMLVAEDPETLFPAPPQPAAFTGLLGECMDFLLDGTDASPVGVLASLVAFCGALMPAWGYWHGRHPSSPFLAIVGRSGDGRKGTAMYRVRDALGNTLGMDVVNRIRFDGVASGEALVKALLERTGETFGVATGVLFEEEYATFLSAAGREGSNLDSRMRSAFDGKQLSLRKVGEKMIVPEPYYLSGLVAITPTELQRIYQRSNFTSGSGNRWLWLPVVRRDVRVVSTEPILPSYLADALLEAHRATFRSPMRIDPTPEASLLLSEYDEHLRATATGTAARMTRRFGVLALRMGMVHAAAERSAVITRDHIARCIELTDYALRGLPYTFGHAAGDADATHLLRMLRDSETGELTQTDLKYDFIREPIRRQAAIDELQTLGMAEVVKVRSKGRPVTVLRLRPTGTVTDTFGQLRDKAETAVPKVPKGVPKVPKGVPKGTTDLSDASTTPRGSESESGPVSRSAVLVPKVPKGVPKGAESHIPLSQRWPEVSKSPVIDHTTGEVMDTTGEWAKPCRDYPNHQTSHHKTPGGWVCVACWPEEEEG